MKYTLNDNVAIAIVAGIALGLGIVAVLIFLKKQESPSSASEPGVTYVYDDAGRLQSTLPVTQKTQFVRLKQAV